MKNLNTTLLALAFIITGCNNATASPAPAPTPTPVLEDASTLPWAPPGIDPAALTGCRWTKGSMGNSCLLSCGVNGTLAYCVVTGTDSFECQINHGDPWTTHTGKPPC